MNEWTWRAGTLLALAALTACQAPPPAPRPAAPKPDRITLLPQADGSPSGVVVRSAGGQAELSQPYATAQISAEGARTSMASPEAVRARHPALYDALPPARRSYVVYFEIGGDRLTSDSAQRLREILAEVAKHPAPEVLVIGHTDTLGTETLNDDISMQRARLVRERLIQEGIDARRIEAVGRGKRELLVSTRDGVAEPRNRRVEIQVR